MIPKKRKIGAGTRVSMVMKKGREVKSRFFIVKYLPNRATVTRFAIITSTKVHKNAVERNIVRRRISEILRTSWHDTNPPCYDVVVIPSPKTVGLTYQQLQKELLGSLYPVAYG